METEKKKSFGETINNPFNLRTGSQWVGLAGAKNGFCVFSELEYGIRAAINTLHYYHQKYGLSRIEEIINRWAPPTENNTLGYISRVCKELNVPKTRQLDFKGVDFLRLILAIYGVETGHKPDENTWDWIVFYWSQHLKWVFYEEKRWE